MEPVNPPGNPPADPPKPHEKGIEAPPTPPTTEAPPAGPPPSAKVVLEGTKTEKELALERQLRERETRMAELEDENHQLKQIPKPPAPSAKEKRKWYEGWTFYDQED